MAVSLLGRFKEIYFKEFNNYELAWSNLDKDYNLTVGIRCKDTKEEKFYLNVKEEDGNIIWY